MNENELIKLVLVELIEELGGVVELDAETVLAKLKTESIKGLTFVIEKRDAKNILLVETVDED